MAERLTHEKAITRCDDGAYARSYFTRTNVRNFFVRQGHKRRRAWERREVARQVTEARADG